MKGINEFLVVLIFFFLKTCLGNSKGGEKNLKLPDKKTFQEEKKKKRFPTQDEESAFLSIIVKATAN